MLSATGALALAAGLVVVGAACWWRAGRWRGVVPYAREAAGLAVLYAGWQALLDVLVTRTSGAVARGRWVWDQERRVHLPSEAGLQHLLSGHSALMRGAAFYYAGVHFVAMGLFLAWAFARHRDRYAEIRWWLVVFTGLAAFVQAVPVAPPRLVPGLGVYDAAARLGVSVYASGGLHDPGQLVAMPSVHVGWAALVAFGVFRLGRGAWRGLGVIHLVLTGFVVVVTGNHYWADGLAALVLLAVAVAVTPVTGGGSRVRLETTGRGYDPDDAPEAGEGRRRRRGAQRVRAHLSRFGVTHPSLGPGGG